MKVRFSRFITLPFVCLVVTLATLSSCAKKNEPPPVPDGLQILLEDGDSLPGNFVILSIESANMAADRSISFIASRTGLPSLNGVFYRTPTGDIRTILTPESEQAGELSFTTVRNLTMAQTGEFAFQVGNRLDDDGLFYSDGETLTTLATTDSDDVLDGFRLLGELRVASGGSVAFSDGTSPCIVDSSGAQDRLTCDLRLHYGMPGDIRTVNVPNAMTNQKASTLILQVNAKAEFAVGLPARGDEPMVGRIRDGIFEALLTRRETLPGLGVLTAAKPRAIGASGAIGIDGSFDTTGDGDKDTVRVLLYRDGNIEAAASTLDQTQLGEIVDLNAVAVDDRDHLYYTAEFVVDGDERDLLRVWDGTETRDIIWDRMWYGGTDPKGRRLAITEIVQTRVLGDGTVLIIVTIGFFEEGTRKITSKQLLRWQDGEITTILQSKSPIGEGTRTLVGFQIADLNSAGDLLLIGEINAKSNRALLLLPSDEVYGTATNDDSA
ncbi:MAG: hypothetical protein VCC00_04065 [Deltaproteobacteria bacterium]